MPSLFTEDEMKDLFLMTHQEFYNIREDFVRPFLRTLGRR